MVYSMLGSQIRRWIVTVLSTLFLWGAFAGDVLLAQADPLEEKKLHRWAISEISDTPGDRSEWILLRYALEKAKSDDDDDYPRMRAALVGLIERGWTANRLIEAGIHSWTAFSVGAPPEMDQEGEK